MLHDYSVVEQIIEERIPPALLPVHHLNQHRQNRGQHQQHGPQQVHQLARSLLLGVYGVTC